MKEELVEKLQECFGRHFPSSLNLFATLGIVKNI